MQTPLGQLRCQYVCDGDLVLAVPTLRGDAVDFARGGGILSFSVDHTESPMPLPDPTLQTPSALIIGATGRLGGILRRAWQVREGFSLMWQTRAAPAPEGWQHWDPLAGGAIPPATVFVGLAGVTGGDAEALALNTPLALQVCAAAQAAGARHVFVSSSAAIYGPTDGAADENAAPDPRNAYGAAKLAMERAVQDWQRTAGPDAPGVTILRIGNVAGADMLLRAAALGPVVLDRVAGQEGGPVRSYIGPMTFARTMAALIMRAAAGEALPPVLNLAAPKPVVMADLLMAHGAAFEWRQAAPGVLPRVVLATGLLERLVPFAEDESCAETMVAQLRALGEGTA